MENDVVSLNEENKTLQTPKEIQKSIYLDHLSVVLSNLAIFMMVVCIVGLVGQTVLFLASGIAFVFYAAMLFFITVCSLGIVLLSDGFRNAWSNLPHFMDGTMEVSKYFEAFYSILPYYSIGMLLISVGSVVCITLNKLHKHPARKVVGIIAAVLSVVVFVFTVAGGKL